MDEIKYCVLVENKDGFYKVTGEPEKWIDILENSNSVEFLEDLIGWGEYTKSFNVFTDNGDFVYFTSPYNPKKKKQGYSKQQGYRKIGYNTKMEQWIVLELKKMADETGQGQAVIIRDALIAHYNLVPPDSTGGST